jgi:hypothetical protein
MERIPWRLKLYAGRTRELSNSTWSAWPCLPCVILIMSRCFVYIWRVYHQQQQKPRIARSLQLSSFLAGQAVRYVMAGDTASPSEYKSATPPPLYFSYRQRRTPCWVNSLRPSASMGRTYAAQHRYPIPVSIPKTSFVHGYYITFTNLNSDAGLFPRWGHCRYLDMPTV